MKTYTLYHNPRWGKSREAVSLLKEKNVVFSVVEYLKEPLTKEEIVDLGKKLGLEPTDFVRKNEKEYKENKIHNCEGSRIKMAKAIETFPKIMERPILSDGEKAIICRPPEKILDLIQK